MDHPRLSEEVDIRHRDPADRDRHDPQPPEAAESNERLTTDHVASSANIYCDFARPNPDLRLARAKLAAEIIKSLDRQSLSTRDAAAKTGIAHSEFSRIRNLTLTRFTLDRLFVILNKLDPQVEVVVEVRDA